MENQNYSYHKVMIVDDAKIDRFLAERVISKYSFAEEVVSVDSAMSALDYLNVHGSDHNSLPDVIFLDINMPEMSGFDFLAEYHKLPEDIKSRCIIVMLSSSLHPEDREMALQSPYVCQFMNKPITEEKLRGIRNGSLAE